MKKVCEAWKWIGREEQKKRRRRVTENDNYDFNEEDDGELALSQT